MFRKLAFGQYSYKDSLMHKLDPRVKIVSVITLSMTAFLIDSYIRIIIFSLFILLLTFMSKLKFTVILRNLRPFFFIFMFILLMYIFFSRDELYVGILTIWKFILFIVIASVLTFTTTISNMVIAIEKLLSILKAIKISPRNFALLISLTIRFIPALFLYADRTKDALEARLGSLRNVKQIKIFMIKLLDRTFQSAAAVSDALTARNYTRERKYYFNRIKLKKKDYLSSILLIIFVLSII